MSPTLIRISLILATVVIFAACAPSPRPLALTPVNGQNADPQAKSVVDWQTQLMSGTLLNEVVQHGVPQAVATQAFAKYDQFASSVKNTAYLSVIDFTQESGKERFFMIETATGHVDALFVAHGSGSDPKATGTPTQFSNVPNSKMTSLGAYLVSETFYSPEHQTAARLDGLESTNSYARPRAIILHSASYVAAGRAKMGMSWGCPAISLDWIARAMARLPGGSFMYAYGLAKASPLDDLKIQQIMTDPAYRWVDEAASAPVDGE